MRTPRFTGLRARLLLSTILGSLLVACVLIGAFNLVLDGRLRGDVDNLLRARAVAHLQTVEIVDGRLSAPETPDGAAPDTQTWIFAGRRALEQPASPPAIQRAAFALAGGKRRFLTLDATDTRFYAVPIVQGSRRLGTLVVSASLGPYERSANTTLIGSLILGLLTVLGVAAASAWVIHRALAPVARMTADAADWGEHDLSRRFFAGEPHDELTKLAATFDGLLERLSQSFRREQRVTAEISHELRTPLAKIVAEAELAAVESPPERYREALASIRAYAESLNRTLDTLLATARSELTSGSRSADAHAVAELAIGNVTSAIPAHPVTIRIDGSAPPARVAAESDLVERALTPVIENAARFARNRVEIFIRADAGQVIFEVRDDGPGVEPSIRDRIFEPGVSASANGSSPVGSGAGLGLPLARRLARAAGGDIEQVSSAQGATFAIRMPSG
ncbi:MAG TPA: HAMP domain-containing sensor histidine kinase [Solirubrobacteraceae bacterium]|jgi:signal transduction histidine kinase